MIYFSSIILNRVECNCFQCWLHGSPRLEKYDFALPTGCVALFFLSFFFGLVQREKRNQKFINYLFLLLLIYLCSAASRWANYYARGKQQKASIILTYKKWLNISEQIKSLQATMAGFLLRLFLLLLLSLSKGVDGLLMALYDFITNRLFLTVLTFPHDTGQTFFFGLAKRRYRSCIIHRALECRNLWCSVSKRGFQLIQLILADALLCSRG